ncbi:MAG TPA: ABC transporter substrate-binding protein [Candidatus Acidoferrales bacterium]|nr:ABC transporter substrate-binding protein [Candidatus Acidoferrales bacterium]
MAALLNGRGRFCGRLVAGVVFAFLELATELNAQTRPKTAVVAHGVDLESLNPYWHNTTANYAVWRHFLEPLVEYDFAKRRYVGVLAESWSGSEHGWTFKIRRHVKFHSGAELTAADIRYSIKRSLDPKLSRQRNLAKVIQAAEAPDPYTVVIATKRPVVSLLDFLDNLYVLSEAAAQESGDEATFGKRPVGTGPFKFVEWVRGERAVGEKNPQYWGGAPKLDRIIWKPVSEDAARLALLESGQADLIANVPPHETDRFKRNPNVRIEEVRSARIIFLLLDPAHKPLDNKLVRQAIHYAIDKDALVKYVLDGKAYRLDGILGPHGIGEDASFRPFSYNPQKAKELLAAAGLPNGFEIDFYTSMGRYTKDREVAQAIAGQLAKVGIRARLHSPEWGVFNDLHRSGKCPICFRGRGTVVDPDDFLNEYFETGVSKRLSYSNAKFDSLLQQQRQIFDLDKRVALLKSALRILLEDAPIVPLYNPVDIYAVNRRLIWKPSAKDYINVAGADLADK